VKYNISFIKPNFPDGAKLIKDYEDIISSNWFTNFGPFERRFSKEAAQYLGSEVFATTISNCTLGLDGAIALLARPGAKKVIIPSFTFAAGPEVLLRNGYEPLFIDIDKKTWQPNIQQAELLIDELGDELGAILLCNIFGVGNEDVRLWEDLAQKNNLPLVIDSAAGFGSCYSNDEKIGSRGDCEVFSFHATKPFAIGEGGLVASKDEKFIEDVRSWQNFGFESDRSVHRIGTNAKLQEINAAIGLHQLEEFSSRLEKRQKVLKMYKDLLEPQGFSFQHNDECSTIPFVSTLAPDAKKANDAHDNLLSNGVEVRKYYKPLHFEEMMKKYRRNDIPLEVTEDVYSRILSLPVHEDMDIDTVTKITSYIID